MHFSHNELVLIYNEKEPRDKKTLAYATTIAPRVNKQELSSVRISSTLFEKALNQLGVPAKAVLNKAHAEYQESLRGRKLSNEEWFHLILNKPELLKAPIAMYKGKAVICNSETDIFRLNARG
ncbi:MAG: arsenate reductase family protein [Luteibaculum sp.]